MSRGLTRDLPEHTPTRREPVVAVVAFGSNLGDRAEVIDSAVQDIARLPLVDQIVMSEPVESVAVRPDGPDESAPAYLNAVALVTTRLAPSVLLGMLHRIETAHGRERVEEWGDRTLDLDLITYGEVVSRDPALLLPHPRAGERTFVLEPWLALDPDAVLPGTGRVDEALAALREEEAARRELAVVADAPADDPADDGEPGEPASDAEEHLAGEDIPGMPPPRHPRAEKDPEGRGHA